MKLDILLLKPTQFSVGIREVDLKIERLKKMTNKEREKFLRARAIPIVVAANEQIFIVDHHHLTRAAWQLGIEKLPVEWVDDYSKLKEKKLWKSMSKKHQVHLLDQFGNGPHAPLRLPEDIRGMADDPYRSLAWAVRREGGYEKSGEFFAEFKWAEFLRKRIVIEHGDLGFERAVRRALKICKSEKCHKMPGFLGGGRSPFPS
jgi:hypothetical protein